MKDHKMRSFSTKVDTELATRRQAQGVAGRLRSIYQNIQRERQTAQNSDMPETLRYLDAASDMIRMAIDQSGEEGNDSEH